jgi:hypothetical protein
MALLVAWLETKLKRLNEKLSSMTKTKLLANLQEIDALNDLHSFLLLLPAHDVDVNVAADWLCGHLITQVDKFFRVNAKVIQHTMAGSFASSLSFLSLSSPPLPVSSIHTCEPPRPEKIKRMEDEMEMMKRAASASSASSASASSASASSASASSASASLEPAASIPVSVPAKDMRESKKEKDPSGKDDKEPAVQTELTRTQRRNIAVTDHLLPPFLHYLLHLIPFLIRCPLC